MSHWNSHRGDEWWYSAEGLEAEASAGAGMFTVEDIDVKSGGLTELAVHALVWDTFQQFQKDLRIYFSLDKQTKPILNALAERGLVTWSLLQHPFSQAALIQSVSQPQR